MSYIHSPIYLNNSKINKELLSKGENNILIHSDISKLLLFEFKNKNAYLQLHLNNLYKITQGLNLWMPSFNYDFITTKIYDVKNDPIQTGVLNNYFYKNSHWRSTTPVFNFCGIGNYPISKLKQNQTINPFTFLSEFDYLYKSNSLYGFYGTNLSCCTLIHFAECMSEKLVYRYYKYFTGKIINFEEVFDVTLQYSVRPPKNMVQYDWDKIKFDLIENNLLSEFKIQELDYFSFFNVKKVVDFWIINLIQNPFYFLKTNSEKIVSMKHKELGRNFEKTDFEI